MKNSVTGEIIARWSIGGTLLGQINIQVFNISAQYRVYILPQRNFKIDHLCKIYVTVMWFFYFIVLGTNIIS